MDPRFFRDAASFRAWLEKEHAKRTELWVGFWKKGSGKGGLTYAEAVDEALCFGWIDGHVKGVDETSYMQRFTPRKAKSVWSNVNVAKVQALQEAGRMAPAGLAAFEARDPARTGIYSFEQTAVPGLASAQEERLRANAKAWAWWQKAPPGYRRNAAFWVVSAKRPETQERRLAELVRCSARGEKVPPFAERRASPPKAAKARRGRGTLK